MRYSYRRMKFGKKFVKDAPGVMVSINVFGCVLLPQAFALWLGGTTNLLCVAFFSFHNLYGICPSKASSICFQKSSLIFSALPTYGLSSNVSLFSTKDLNIWLFQSAVMSVIIIPFSVATGPISATERSLCGLEF